MTFAQRKKQLRQLLGLVFLIFIIGVTFIGLLNLQTVQEYLSRASGDAANIVVDYAQEQGTLPRPWLNLAQGGEDKNWNPEPIASKIRSLKPQYIRIDHIYDFFDIVKRDGGSLTFDFSRLDTVLNGIRAAGATPFISLSYTPPVLSANDIVGKPTSWDEWALTIQKTIEHVSGTRGFENVYYEVWNEPDLFGQWKPYGDKNYLTMYSYASQGAQRARGVKSFKFGGPATTALYKNWFDALAKMHSEGKIRFDFFSWHRYHRSLTQFEEDARNVKSWLGEYPQLANIELIISEWGHDPEVDDGYDGNYSAAHTAAAAIVMTGQINRAFVFEIEDGKHAEGKERWGRWGLLTHQSFGANAKPRYIALTLLNRLAETQIGLSGNGSWVKGLATKKENGSIQVLLANYDQASRNSEVVPLTYTNILPGEYTLNQTGLGGRQESTKIATDAAVLQTMIRMPVQSVNFIELIPNFDINAATPPITVSTPESTPVTTTAPSVISPTEVPLPFTNVTPRSLLVTPTITPETGLGRLLNR